MATQLRFRSEVALTRLELAELLLEHYPDEKAEAPEHLDFAIGELREIKVQPSLERALKDRETLYHECFLLKEGRPNVFRNAQLGVVVKEKARREIAGVETFVLFVALRNDFRRHLFPNIGKGSFSAIRLGVGG